MNKMELIEVVKEKCGLTKSESAVIVDTFFSELVDALTRGDRIEIRGLCSFYIKEYKGYTGRNPQTGEPVQILPKKLPFFKCGKDLKERLHKKKR